MSDDITVEELTEKLPFLENDELQAFQRDIEEDPTGFVEQVGKEDALKFTSALFLEMSKRGLLELNDPKVEECSGTSPPPVLPPCCVLEERAEEVPAHQTLRTPMNRKQRRAMMAQHRHSKTS